MSHLVRERPSYPPPPLLLPARLHRFSLGKKEKGSRDRYGVVYFARRFVFKTQRASPWFMSLAKRIAARLLLKRKNQRRRSLPCASGAIQFARYEFEDTSRRFNLPI